MSSATRYGSREPPPAGWLGWVGQTGQRGAISATRIIHAHLTDTALQATKSNVTSKSFFETPFPNAGPPQTGSPSPVPSTPSYPRHYIIRASFSQERMTYIPEDSEVIYRSKDGKEEKVFDALEWLAAMCSHVPNKGEQMVRYYGYYSNVSRGKRKKDDQDDQIPSILESDGSSSEYRKNWARLIQKIYEVDPLTCPKCQGPMRVIAFIEDSAIVQKILKHLGL